MVQARLSIQRTISRLGELKLRENPCTAVRLPVDGITLPELDLSELLQESHLPSNEGVVE
jgi:hypothetical protein